MKELWRYYEMLCLNSADKWVQIKTINSGSWKKPAAAKTGADNFKYCDVPPNYVLFVAVDTHVYISYTL